MKETTETNDKDRSAPINHLLCFPLGPTLTSRCILPDTYTKWLLRHHSIQRQSLPLLIRLSASVDLSHTQPHLRHGAERQMLVDLPAMLAHTLQPDGDALSTGPLQIRVDEGADDACCRQYLLFFFLRAITDHAHSAPDASQAD